jgi:PmbA protein
MNYTEFKQQVFRLAEDAKVDAFELYASEGRSVQVSVAKGEIDRYQDATSGGAGLKVLKNGRAGFAFTEVYDRESAATLVAEAVANLTIVNAGSSDRVYESRDDYPTVPEYDGAFDSISPDAQIEWALGLERAALAHDERISMVPTSAVAVFTGTSRMANSAGLDLSHRSGGAYAYTQALAVDGDSRKTGMHFATALRPDDFDLASVGRSASDKALAMLGAASIRSGKYPVVIHREQVASFLQVLMSMVSAENVHKGLSALEGKLDTDVGSPAVTVVDEPIVVGSLFNEPFDGQGVATRRKEIVSGGRLTTFLHSLKTAAKDGVAPTGNGFRDGYRGAETIRPVNLVLLPGEKEYEALLAELDRGLVINWLSALHAGADPASGQFSLSATGLLVENGSVTRPVDQITISGSFTDVLSRIRLVGNDLEQAPVFSYGVYTPSVLVSEIDVAGE